MKQGTLGKFILILVLISIAVAFLMHFPELISIFGPDKNELFPDMSIADVISEIVFTFISVLILFALNVYIFGFNRLSIKITWKRIFLSFVLTWILSNLMGKAFIFMHNQWDIPIVHNMMHHYLHPLRDFMNSCIVVVSCYIIYLLLQKQKVQIENQQLHAENLLNQYEALKNQLNPHMLFNSLNTLRSLIRETPDRAQDYLQELSFVLRYTLQENDNKLVTLKEEMDFVHAYMFLLKMRYEDNLEFNVSIEKKTEEYQLPPMSIQLLIENAVKHNEISNRRPLIIHISAEGRSLIVSNPVQPKITASKGTGIGLANLSKRYRLLLDKDITVTQEKNQFIVTIPLI